MTPTVKLLPEDRRQAVADLRGNAGYQFLMEDLWNLQQETLLVMARAKTEAEAGLLLRQWQTLFRYWEVLAARPERVADELASERDEFASEHAEPAYTLSRQQMAFLNAVERYQHEQKEGV